MHKNRAKMCMDEGKNTKRGIFAVSAFCTVIDGM